LSQWLYNIADHHTIGWYHWFLPSKDEFVFDHMNGGLKDIGENDDLQGHLRYALAVLKKQKAAEEAAVEEEYVASPSRAGG